MPTSKRQTGHGGEIGGNTILIEEIGKDKTSPPKSSIRDSNKDIF